MNNKNIQILSTKKLSSAHIHLTQAQGIFITDIDFLNIQTHVTTATQTILENIEEDAVLFFTSQYAVKATAPFLQNKKLQIYCINGVTLQTVKMALPKASIIASASYAANLIKWVILHPTKKYYFFCGNKSLNTIPDFFEKNNIPLHKIEVYINTETPQKIEKIFDAVMFYSPSGVQSFLTINAAPLLGICIGTTTAKALSKNKNTKVLISDAPRIENMIELIKNYYK